LSRDRGLVSEGIGMNCNSLVNILQGIHNVNHWW
jgi:hypothetical protein